MQRDVVLKRFATFMAVLAFALFLFAAYTIFSYAMGSVLYGWSAEASLAIVAALLLSFLSTVGPWYGRDSGLSAKRRLAWLFSPAVPLAVLIVVMAK